MPDYEVTDPQRKLTLTVTGPAPPSQAMLDVLFHDAAMKTAHIGPTPDDAPVTLGDLIDNPKTALQRMVTLTKQGLSDPKNYIPLAIGALAGGARAMGLGTGAVPAAAAESAAEAAPAARVGIGQAIRQGVKLDDVVDAIPGAKNLKAVYRIGRAVQQARQGTPTSAPKFLLQLLQPRRILRRLLRRRFRCLRRLPQRPRQVQVQTFLHWMNSN